MSTIRDGQSLLDTLTKMIHYFTQTKRDGQSLLKKTISFKFEGDSQYLLRKKSSFERYRTRSISPLNKKSFK